MTTMPAPSPTEGRTAPGAALIGGTYRLGDGGKAADTGGYDGGRARLLTGGGSLRRSWRCSRQRWQDAEPGSNLLVDPGGRIPVDPMPGIGNGDEP